LEFDVDWAEIVDDGVASSVAVEVLDLPEDLRPSLAASPEACTVDQLVLERVPAAPNRTIAVITLCRVEQRSTGHLSEIQ